MLSRVSAALVSAFALAPTLALAPPRPTASEATPATRQASLRATVYVFLATDCPMAGRYGPRVAQLSARFSRRGVKTILVFPNPRETDETVAAFCRDRKLSLPISRDASLARRFGASVSPQAALIDSSGKRVYLGRVDDSVDPTRVTRHDLDGAVSALLAKRPIRAASGPSVGCPLDLSPRATGVAGDIPTYRQQIAPILQKHCVSCHRPGDVGPMPLDRYETVGALASKIRELTRKRTMPPWKAVSRGEFHDENRLSDAQISQISRWADAGAPEGDGPIPLLAAAAPANGWPIGTPEIVLELPKFSVPASGKDLYRCFVVKPGLDSDRWIRATSFVPGNRSVVHHVSVFVDLTGRGKKLDDADPGPGYTNPTPGNGPGFAAKEGVYVLGGWTPGHSPRVLPERVGIPLPKDAHLIVEVHYALSGKPETDATKLGLHFASEPIDQRLRLGDISNVTFRIPAGATAHPVDAGLTLTEDITILSITPHMHKRGVSMRVEAQLPDGSYKKLVEVKNWDFNWQPSYRFREPVRLPRNTRLVMKAVFDNSARNPNNPDRTPREIPWGEGSDDEMCTAFVAFTIDSERLSADPVIVAP